MDKVYINTDGGARGNPGPAAIGIVFYDEQGKELHRYHKTIGRATNNEAEYQAIIKALELLMQSKWFAQNNVAEKEVICRLDSQLVVEQINGRYKIKQEHIKLLIAQLRQMIGEMQLNISFVYIPRTENKLADKLVNKALDHELKS